MSSRCSSRGFTLIELMVVVAVIALLAALAYPSYLEHLRRSRRAEAQALLMNLANRQQQFLLDTRSYADSPATLTVPVPGSVSAHYTVTMVVSTSTTPAFTATAAPLAGQAGDRCGAIQISHAGEKSPPTCW